MYSKRIIHMYIRTYYIASVVLHPERLVSTSGVTGRVVRVPVRAAYRTEYLLVTNASVRTLRFKHWLVPARIIVKR